MHNTFDISPNLLLESVLKNDTTGFMDALPQSTEREKYEALRSCLFLKNKPLAELLWNLGGNERSHEQLVLKAVENGWADLALPTLKKQELPPSGWRYVLMKSLQGRCLDVAHLALEHLIFDNSSISGEMTDVVFEMGGKETIEKMRAHPDFLKTNYGRLPANPFLSRKEKFDLLKEFLDHNPNSNFIQKAFDAACEAGCKTSIDLILKYNFSIDSNTLTWFIETKDMETFTQLVKNDKIPDTAFKYVIDIAVNAENETFLDIMTQERPELAHAVAKRAVSQRNRNEIFLKYYQNGAFDKKELYYIFSQSSTNVLKAIQQAHPDVFNKENFETALRKGNAEAIRLLIEEECADRKTCADHISYILLNENFSAKESIELADLLATKGGLYDEDCDINDQKLYLQFACEAGHMPLVKKIIEVNPESISVDAFLAANHEKNYKILRYLFSLKREDVVTKALLSLKKNHPKDHEFFQNYLIKKQKRILGQHLMANQDKKRKLKI